MLWQLVIEEKERERGRERQTEIDREETGIIDSHAIEDTHIDLHNKMLNPLMPTHRLLGIYLAINLALCRIMNID